uniref:Uncharacterized protein n=1 Tax=Kalanchoe fedtschenkoi TaxID=63787 RepID=A0A7N1A6C6_KALFE
MGKWNNRWIPNPRSYRHDNRGRFQRELPPPYPAESSENSVPEWEKKFCYLVGSVPWRKVLDTKMFASCYPDVINWDASEAEDTFLAAKRRFWARINGLPTDDVPMPDPNAYIEKIDWNACVDTELFVDLERALLAADVDTTGENEAVGTGVVDISALTQNPKWQEWNQGAADDVWGSGGARVKPDNWGWGPDEPKIEESGDNPWECSVGKTDGPVKTSAWGDSNDKPGGWRQPEHSHQTKNLHVGNPRDGNFHGRGAAKGNGWAVSGNNSWGRNHQQNNFKETKARGYGPTHHNGASTTRQWVRHGDNSKCGNSWDNKGDRKRESPNNYAPRSKSPRFHRTDNLRLDQREGVKSWRNALQTTG